MKRLALIALLLVACSGKQPAPPAVPQCSEAELDVLAAMFEQAALGVIVQGKCDDYLGGDVSNCPAYSAIEASFKLSAAAMCRVPR